MSKINVGLIFGGRSAEHEISLRSAQNIIEAMDKDKYKVIPIAINKEGKWYTSGMEGADELKFPLKMEDFSEGLNIPLDGFKGLKTQRGNNEISIDIYFPVLHGPYGEDGSIQGLFRLLQMPFVGCGVLGSSVGMDKDVMKRLFLQAGIPIGKYLSAFPENVPDFGEVESFLGIPVYVKPANLGSSVGISKVRNEEEYREAIKLAFNYDVKIVIEENIDGKEIECAVLGNRKAKASKVGLVKSSHDFYDYTSKYLDSKGFQLEIPAAINENIQEKIRDLAIKVFKALDTEGLGRVDVFLKNNGEVIVNEINTMPGFTSISMYPMLWKASGLPYTKLIDELINLGFERHEELAALKTSI